MDKKYALIMHYQKGERALFNFPVFHRARIDSHAVPAQDINFNLRVLEECSVLTYELHQKNSSTSSLGFDSLEEAVEAAEILLKIDKEPKFNNFNPDKDSLKAIIGKLMPTGQNEVSVFIENNPVIVDYTFGTLYPHRMNPKNMERAKKVKLKYNNDKNYLEYMNNASRFFKHGVCNKYGIPYN